MFGLGDLFNEDDSDQKWTYPLHNAEREEVPVSPRLSCGLCGINNQGATCYMNSLLQTLLMTPEFRERLFHLGQEHLGCLADKDKKGAKVRVIPIQLQRLFARLLLLDAQSASTTELTDSFGWTNSEELVQHDVQELNRILFSAIEDSLVGTPDQDIIRNLYHGTIVNQIVCQVCGRISEREEDFLDICVTVSGMKSLEESLGYSYINTEALDGNNQYRCDACRKLVNATKGAKLRHLPPVLSVSLLRFGFDFKKMERVKENGRFTFPMEIDMAPYVENPVLSGSKKYEIFSVLVHSGGSHGGHYTAYIRDIDALGTWTHPDKEDIQVAADPTSGKVDLIECESPVQLLQIILGKIPDQGMRVDKLCAEVMNQTGVSWNKRFKKQCGPINKFLRSHDDVFELSQDVNWVCLKVPFSGMNSTSPPQQSSESSPQRESQKTKKQQRPPSPAPSEGDCWFFYNDNRVQPVRTKELEKQFAGRSSAYMLFYRLKSLTRPPDACNNPQYAVPPSLLRDICEETYRLQEKRKAYEIKINTIVIKLLFPRFLIYDRGALQTRADSLEFVELSIDRRKTIGELMATISDMYAELVPEDCVLQSAKLLPAGTHLYHCLSSDPDRQLMGVGIMHGSRYLVWDGLQINGEDIPTGDACEPIELQITYSNASALTHGFPSNLTLGELRVMLSNMTGADLDTMVLNRVNSSGGDTTVHSIEAEDHGQTLREAGLKDGEQIIVESSSQGQKSCLTEKAISQKSQLVSFIVENRCGHQVNSEWPITSVQIDKNSTVGELKAVILSSLTTNNIKASACRLRCEDDNLGLLPPLHECKSVESEGLNQGCRLVLELGEAPRSNEITLTVEDGSSSSHEEVIIERRILLRDLLKRMIQQTGNEGEDWHLRRTNWCGEAVGVIDDMDATVAECQLKNGDHLMLEKGALPPKGFIKLSVYFYPSIHHMSCVSDGMGGITSSLQGLSGKNASLVPDQASPVLAGDIIAWKESTLEELKLQILTLPGLERIAVPMMEFLRVRLVQNGYLSTILRDNNQTLQRYKLTGGTALGVQVLSREEALSPNQLVLQILKRIAGTNTYRAPVELIWDCTQSSAPDSLQQAVADRLALPAEHLVLAKHLPDKYEWLEISNDKSPTQNKESKGKKKGGGAKVNLKQAPYHLKDGDRIGVKSLEEDPLRQDDFSTDGDLEGREMLRKQADDKKKRREELRKANEAMGNFSPTKSRRPEVGIKIHVDKFT